MVEMTEEFAGVMLAVHGSLRDGPKLMVDLIDELCGVQEGMVREAVWHLIEDGHVRVNWDTELELSDQMDEDGDWRERAASAAEAFGVTIMFGVRFKRTWFVHADGIEFDCASPAEGVDTIINALVKRAREQRADASAELRKVEQALKAIGRK